MHCHRSVVKETDKLGKGTVAKIRENSISISTGIESMAVLNVRSSPTPPARSVSLHPYRLRGKRYLHQVNLKEEKEGEKLATVRQIRKHIIIINASIIVQQITPLKSRCSITTATTQK